MLKSLKRWLSKDDDELEVELVEIEDGDFEAFKQQFLEQHDVVLTTDLSQSVRRNSSVWARIKSYFSCLSC